MAHLREEEPHEILARRMMQGIDEAFALVKRKGEVPLAEIDRIAQKYGLHTESIIANLQARGAICDWAKGVIRWPG